MNKAKILQVGTFDENNMPVNWTFDCKGGVPVFNITDDGLLIAGYSVDELRAIADNQ